MAGVIDENEFVRKDVHEEFIKRMEEAEDRQNHRISALESTLQRILEMSASIERLATNMGHMAKEQEAQKDNINEVGERLKVLEQRDGEKWRNVTSYIITTVLGIVLGYLATKFGLK